MQCSDSDLEVLRSLVEEREDAQLGLALEIRRHRVDLNKLQMRVDVLGPDDLDDREGVELHELPSRIAKLEEDRKDCQRRLQKLQSQMLPETSDAKPPVGLVGG